MILLRKNGGPGMTLRALMLLPALAALPAGPAGTAAAQSAGRRGAILVRGNRWVTGVPGFGDNAFPALKGEYRLEMSGPAGEDRPAEGRPAEAPDFSIWLSAEPLVFSEGLWRPRSGVPGALEREDGEGRYVSLPLSGDRGAWTAVFLFHGTQAPPDDASLNRLLGAWTDRFLYYSSLVKIVTDVSMPAVVYF
jgi:hypothetical protein